MSPKISFLLCCIVRSVFETKLLCAITFFNPVTGPVHLVRHELMTLLLIVVSEVTKYFVIVALFSRYVSERPVLQHRYL